ncbi:tyrosinase family protein [Actinoplanes solisilvae]|uniref:tyrosinase family protein n=1 Tax=Actinoplanes solisilvae TaxID=2486853 RepID=UPI000FDCD4F7|nr:tyrosinase family protein [Actinoplanes solisilvae]
MSVEQVVASPTYLADIRNFFRPEDIEHMALKGIDLATYDGVKRNALSVFTHTAPPTPDMPPDAEGQWSAERSQTFRNWIVNGFPMGVAVPPVETPDTPSTRIRKNIETLSESELETLKTAFAGLMARPASAPDSYFALAGIHGLSQRWCLHHEDRYNPWHRVYLQVFEDALRSVPGCADVTLPYWDIRTPLPDRLQEPPFDQYALPEDPGAAATPQPVAGYFPYKTERFSPAEIALNVEAFGVLSDIATSMKQSIWGEYNVDGYQDFSIQAHDGGHGSIGPTMGDQNVASFDPVFWFFHCNLDRLWLSWQHKVGATTLTGFKSTLTTSAEWLSAPFNALPPFDATSDASIDLPIAYDKLDTGDTMENTVGSLRAARTFSIKRSSPVSVRVKGISRLDIPGSFAVNLLADGRPIAKRYFFQPNLPRDCETCRKHGIINIDFRLDQDSILDRTLTVTIDVPGHGDQVGTAFPLDQAGSPTINARLLLEDE